MSGRRRMIVAVVASVAVLLVYFVFLLKPKLDQISETREDILTAQQEERDLRATLARLEEVRADAPGTAARLLVASEFLPSTPDLPGFIRLLQEAADLSGTDLQSIAPSQPATLSGSTGVQAISVTVVVQASFRRIEDFLTRLETLRRVVQVTALSLAPQVDELSGQVTLASTLTMTMFVVQPNARVAAAAGGRASPSPSPAASPSPTSSPSPGASP